MCVSLNHVKTLNVWVAGLGLSSTVTASTWWITLIVATSRLSSLKTIIAGINPSGVNRDRSHVRKPKKISTKVSPSKYCLQNKLDGRVISHDSNIYVKCQDIHLLSAQK